LESTLGHWRQWIGKTEQATDTITPRLVGGLRATLNDDPAVADGAPAPLAVHWCLAPPSVAMDGLGPDGHPARGGFLPPVPLPRRMWAGGKLSFHDRLRVGDVVTRRSVIQDVSMKEGRTGTLCFVAVDHEISTDRGVAIRERHDIVYRDFDRTKPAPTPAQAAAPLQATWQRSVMADPVLLFRYSALTFNGHRIHYDRTYCIEEEGYPGLVVHGPLQATLLLEFAASIRDGRAPAVFDFRGVSPLFDGAPFTLNAVEDGDDLKLWTADAHGRTNMEAKAGW
jgi:3-methylfumaryl-CoA hydratase